MEMNRMHERGIAMDILCGAWHHMSKMESLEGTILFTAD